MNLLNYLRKGYSVSNLKYMRLFYKAYPNKEQLISEIEKVLESNE